MNGLLKNVMCSVLSVVAVKVKSVGYSNNDLCNWLIFDEAEVPKELIEEKLNSN